MKTKFVTAALAASRGYWPDKPMLDGTWPRETL
jgi:hypothetical protein